MIIFRDSVLDKYKDCKNLEHLEMSQEFCDLQIYIINLIDSLANNKEEFLFNVYYYQDLYKVIRMVIAQEFKITKTYKERLVTVKVCVDIVEEYFINEELTHEEYRVNILPGKPIFVVRNNEYDINYKYNEYEIDGKFLGTDIYIDIKSIFNSYSQIVGFDSQEYISLNFTSFKKYYNKIKNNEASDVWMLVYYNTNQYSAGFRFINMQTLMKYFYVDKKGKIRILSSLNQVNPFKKDIDYKLVDINYKDERIFFDFILTYTKNAFLTFLNKKYVKDDIWI